MTVLDRLLELAMKDGDDGIVLTELEEQEYDSLKKEIQGLIEKGEKLKDNSSECGLYWCYCGKCVIQDVRKIIPELEQQNKALTEQVKQLQEERIQIEKNFKVTMDKMLDCAKSHKTLKSEYDQLKSKIEKIIKDPYWKVHTGNLTHDSYVTYSQTELQMMIGQKFKELAKEIIGDKK